MPYAIRASKDNIDFIIAYGNKLGMTLDHIRDNIEYNAEEFGQDTYVITDGQPQNNNVTFTEMMRDDFFATWRFTATAYTHSFSRIERV